MHEAEPERARRRHLRRRAVVLRESAAPEQVDRADGRERESDRELEREPDTGRDDEVEQHDRPAGEKDRQRMPESPQRPDPRGGREPPRARGDRGDSDDVIGIGGVAHAQDEAQCDDGERFHGSRTIAGRTRGGHAPVIRRPRHGRIEPPRRSAPGGAAVLATIRSAALLGLEAVPVTIEVSITNGLPAFHIVGLPDAAVREARQRVVSALRESGFQFPLRRITANLAPAALRKEGSAFDLPIALAVLAATGQVPAERAQGWLVVGELALDGRLRRVRGALAYAECAAAVGFEALVAPAACASEAALAEALPVWPASSLGEVAGWLRGCPLPGPAVATPAPAPRETERDERITLDDIAGQERAKRALEAAAAGGHNVVFVGPPGAGKTLLARALPGLLPPLAPDESRELTRIHSVAGLLQEGAGLVTARPFRAPHASITPPALLGGGSVPRPGEVTLAHHGVLFLDELPEFRRDALEALRQPLEDGIIAIARAGGAHRFPAAFQLVAACNE